LLTTSAMRLARYRTGVGVVIEESAPPADPNGGLIVETKACGLCSGELMEWYMERKAPHVLGHEVSGTVVASDDPGFPLGTLVAPHHHANCGECESCRRGLEVHCEQWRSTRLEPGGMAERFRIPEENLADTWRADSVRPVDAALMEPIACVAKSIRMAGDRLGERIAILGLGSLGIAHALLLQSAFNVEPDCIEPKPARRDWSAKVGLRAMPAPDRSYDTVFVLPGTEQAVRDALAIVSAGGRVVLFAPLPPSTPVGLDFEQLYFREVQIVSSFSCGRTDTREAIGHLSRGVVRAEALVSHFISLDELPDAYAAMKRGDILKAMVVF
jgi:L-iditol 2-dehydrogenase